MVRVAITLIMGIIIVGLVVFLPQERISATQGYTLNDLYRIALQRAEVIMISKDNLYVSERTKDKAVSALMPRISIIGGYTRYFLPTDNIVRPDDVISGGVRVDQSFSLAGKEFIALRGTRVGVDKSKYDLYAVKEKYLLRVASAYYDVRSAKGEIEIAAAHVERLTGHRDAAAKRFKVGEVTKTDLLRAEAELAGAKSELIMAENALEIAKAILARVVGLTGDFVIRDSNARYKNIAAHDLNLLKKTALAERAEMRSSILQSKMAEKEVRHTKGAYWPTLSIEAVYMRTEENPAHPLFIEESLHVGFRLNFLIFDGGLRRAEIRQTKARQRQAELLREDLRKSINIEVESVYLDLMTQKGILEFLENQVIFAKDNFDLISRKYEFGLATGIDVMDASALLVTSKRQLSEAAYNYELSLVRLKRATGTLLESVEGR